jgi:predicted nucleic acid-binding protein
MLFDTDVIIWALRGNPKAADVIDKTQSRFISSVTYMELVKGARNKADRQGIKSFIRDLSFEVLPISGNISHRAVIYMEEFTLKSGLDMADALIAATASESSLKLCTGNSKLYKVVPDIELSVFKPE